MRKLLPALFCLLSLLAISAASADDCRCKGCGCRGGPGWRGPDGHCVNSANMDRICGTPPGSHCTHEGVTQICFGGSTSQGGSKSKAPPL